MIFRHLALAGLAAALPAQQGDSLAARIPQGFRNVVYVGDVLPRIKTLLTSERLEAAWKEMAPGLAVLEPSLRGVSPRSMIGPLELIETLIPQEAVLAMPDRTMADYGALLHGGLALAFGYLVVDQGGIDEPALEGFRDLAAELFNDVEAPTFQLSLRARNERIAETWFDDALDMLETMSVVEGMQVVVEDQLVRVEVSLGSLVDSPLIGELGMFGMADASGVLPADHGATEQIRAWLTSLRLRVELQQQGDVLELRVGELPEGSGDGARTFDADTVLQVEWVAEEFLPFADSAYEMVYAFDEEAIDFLDAIAPGQYWSLLDMLTDLSATTASGATRIAATDQEVVIDVVQGLEEEGFVPPRLGETGIEDFIPERVALSDASSFWTLDEYLLVQFDEILMSLYDLSFDLYEQGLEETSDAIDVWTTYLEEDLGDLHSFFEGEDSALFAEGVVLLVEEMTEEATPAIALVGLPHDRADTESFVEEFADLIRATDGVSTGARTIKASVQDGVEAIVFDVPGSEITADSFADAAFAPHAAFAGDALVLSTSAAFTRRILAAQQKPAAPAEGELTARLHTTGEQAGRMFAAVVTPLLGDSREGRQGRALVRAIRVALGLLESIDVEDVDDEDQTQQRIRLRY